MTGHLGAVRAETSRKTSKRTRIETLEGLTAEVVEKLREKHPREQGLKLRAWVPSERFGHASRKTSKRTRIETRYRSTAIHYLSDFEKNIQENKDWNPLLPSGDCRLSCFEKNIQENKDWNLFWPLLRSGSPKSSRKTSKRTRIETRGWSLDWKGKRELREKHPREQGLKRDSTGNYRDASDASRKTSKRTRIETSFSPNYAIVSERLREKHPREQGLKPSHHGFK